MNEFTFKVLYDDEGRPTNEDLYDRLKELIGDDTEPEPFDENEPFKLVQDEPGYVKVKWIKGQPPFRDDREMLQMINTPELDQKVKKRNERRQKRNRPVESLLQDILERLEKIEKK